jgi:putative transposase
MRDRREEFHIAAMCRALEISPSGYYAWRRRKPAARAAEDKRLLERVRATHEQSRSTYGSPKVYRRLRRTGERINHKRVERLMREAGIRAKRARKRRRATDSSHPLPVAENVLAGGFTAARPDEVWTSDVTYAWTREGRLYLVAFLDLFSRLVVGWAVSETSEVGFVEAAFLAAQQRRGQAVSPLVHSDRGSRYASAASRARLAAWGCSRSMSRKGNCRDNAVTESFFGVLKAEMVHHERFGVHAVVRVRH